MDKKRQHIRVAVLTVQSPGLMSYHTIKEMVKTIEMYATKIVEVRSVDKLQRFVLQSDNVRIMCYDRCDWPLWLARDVHAWLYRTAEDIRLHQTDYTDGVFKAHYEVPNTNYKTSKQINQMQVRLNELEMRICGAVPAPVVRGKVMCKVQ